MWQDITMIFNDMNPPAEQWQYTLTSERTIQETSIALYLTRPHEL